jgi:hypothetical protein
VVCQQVHQAECLSFLRAGQVQRDTICTYSRKKPVTNMRSDWSIIAALAVILMTFCAKPKSEWLKWQESLDLAYPNTLSFKIHMEKKVFYEGEPIVFKILLSNKTDVPQTIIYSGPRSSMIVHGLHTFKVVTELDSVLIYAQYTHSHGSSRPEDAIVLGPYDTLYSHAILCPDLFRQYEFPMERTSLSQGDYLIESNIHLGTKFYPRPARGLDLTSPPTMFSIESLPTEERIHLSRIRPYMKNFFGHVEECLFPLDSSSNHRGFVDSALFWLDRIRNTSSYFAQYADFVYTCIPAVTRSYDDTVKLNKSIAAAKEFINRYDGSILAEEMEFKRVWWLYRKDSTGTEFNEQAKKTINKYPKNLNSFGIKKHIRQMQSR